MKQIKTNKDKDKKPSKHELLGSLSSICNMLVIGESNSKRETNQCADRLAKSRTKLEQDFVVYGSPLDFLFYDLLAYTLRGLCLTLFLLFRLY